MVGVNGYYYSFSNMLRQQPYIFEYFNKCLFKTVNINRLGSHPLDVSFSFCIDQSGESQSPKLFASQRKPTILPRECRMNQQSWNPVYTCVLWSLQVPHTDGPSQSSNNLLLLLVFFLISNTSIFTRGQTQPYVIPCGLEASETKQAHVINTLPLPFHCANPRPPLSSHTPTSWQFSTIYFLGRTTAWSLPDRSGKKGFQTQFICVSMTEVQNTVNAKLVL